VPLLEQSTPSSERRRWQGTRASFAELSAAVAGCVQTAGHKIRNIEVKAGTHSGKLASVTDLRTELTEAIWLAARRIDVSLYSEGAEAPGLTLVLDEPLYRTQPVLHVIYYGGTAGSREVLRNLVERLLPPDQPDPRRHAKWLGPLTGLLFEGTWLLIGTRIPRIKGVHAHVSTTVSVILLVFLGLSVAWLGWYWMGVLLNRWFPALERLPDTGVTRWSRAQVWVGVAIAVWLAVIGAMLALPER
jgi:hypothetical protein